VVAWEQYDLYISLQTKYYDSYCFSISGGNLYCVPGPVMLSFSYLPENMLYAWDLKIHKIRSVDELIQEIVGDSVEWGLLHPHRFVREYWRDKC
jgi:hypothetical protein